MNPHPARTHTTTPPAATSTALTWAELAALPTTVDLMTAARALGIGRTTAYTLARTQRFPCRLLHVGGTYRVPTAELLRLLGIDPATLTNPAQQTAAS